MGCNIRNQKPIKLGPPGNTFSVKWGLAIFVFVFIRLFKYFPGLVLYITLAGRCAPTPQTLTLFRVGEGCSATNEGMMMIFFFFSMLPSRVSVSALHCLTHKRYLGLRQGALRSASVRAAKKKRENNDLSCVNCKNRNVTNSTKIRNHRKFLKRL